MVMTNKLHLMYGSMPLIGQKRHLVYADRKNRRINAKIDSKWRPPAFGSQLLNPIVAREL
jgi:hypothetical protein